MLFLTAISCQKDDVELVNEKRDNISVSNNSIDYFTAKVIQYKSQNSANKISVSSDTKTVNVVEDSNLPGYHAVTEKLINYDPSDFETTAYYFDDKDNVYAVAILHSVVDSATNTTKIDLYDESRNYLLTTTMKNSDHTLQVTGSKNQKCGQLVATCLSDMYTNNGWDSVGLSILSAFFPEAIVAATIICIKRKC